MDTLSPTDQQARHGQLRTTLEGLLAIQSLDPRIALNQASDLVAATVGADKVDIFVNDSSVDTLVALGTSDTSMGRHQVALGLNRLPLHDGGRTAEVFQYGVPYWSGHVDEDPVELPGIKYDLGVRSAVIVPLDVDGVRRGILQIDSVQPDRFPKEDVSFFQAVAHWIGLILHRAELGERSMRDAAEEARRRTANELIMVLAHDLRVPIVPLMGYVDMMRKQAEQEGKDQYAEPARLALRSIRRLDRMLNDLLDTSRLEQGLFVLTLDVVDLAALVRETVEVVRPPEARIEVHAPEALPVPCDPNRIRQALQNLLSNALHYSPKDAPVVIEVNTEHGADQDAAVITVQDAGPGIAPDLLPGLFTRFTTNRRDGLGLGLYLARGIAEAHGGTLTVDSTPGKGTSFQLALPLRR